MTTMDVRVTTAGVLRSEWTKFRSLRSTYWTLIITVIVSIGLGVIVSAVQASQWPHASPGERAGFDPVMSSLAGTMLGQLGVGVLGVLLISGEYSTGMIRATMTAVPMRLPVLWSKLAVFTAVITVAAFTVTLVAFFSGQALLSSQHIQTTLGHGDALRRVIGAALYLIVIGILGMALGALWRNTAAGISTLAGLVFVLPILAEALPSSWGRNILPYMPANAGQSLWAKPDTAHLAPWTGFAVLCAYAVAAVAVAAFLLHRRDT
ncbi:MAG TPA: hypothetical protein VHC49_00305 [Mycobacteriales bacterium]|nr:hypothetical protein [Mycobacteriales bacterium]